MRFQAHNSTQKKAHSHVVVWGLAGLLVATTGCALTEKTGQPEKTTPDWKTAFQKDSEKSVEFGQPERMAVIWSDSIASAGGVSSVRGFGGRVYFYDRAGDPIRVDGELSIYAFDESSGEEKATPDRVFRFPQADFQKHFGETQLGPSYSVWLPWDKVGGDQKSVVLLPMFKTKDNQVVKSEQSLNFLPGKNPPKLVDDPMVPYRVLGSSSSVTYAQPAKNQADHSNSNVRLVSNTEPADSQTNSPAARTTTIDVPRQMRQRMRTDLASATVEGVASDMQTNVSFGPRNEIAPPVKPGSPNQQAAKPNTAAPSRPEDPAARPRAVFGAPGALK